MAMNLVQFQPGLSMVEFMQQYGTEAKCYRALYRARWPEGFRCPACDERRRCRFHRGPQIYYQCRACRHQTTLVSGTIFQATKLPLRQEYAPKREQTKDSECEPTCRVFIHLRPNAGIERRRSRPPRMSKKRLPPLSASRAMMVLRNIRQQKRKSP